MTLTAGSRIGPYEILEPLGKGGMGEVYRARDTRLDRDVAIKILPEAFARDVERLARFEREAKTLASLNHPNIAAIYGLEVAQAFRPAISALVMELVDGEELSGRIARGAIPIADALAIARQIAEALEAAHERGIIHRDLKPANIKVRDDGTVKVLDFGLAKALDSSSGSNPDLMNSPTITSPATQMGMILGTAAYMAPEQAKGRAIDRRADVWAFGVVLFEMLTGTRVFEGGDITEVLASVIKDTPSHETLPADTPLAIRRLLRRCLEKNPAKRLDSMAAARLEIDEATGAPEQEGRAAATEEGGPRWRRATPWAVSAAALIIAAAAGVAAWRTPAPAESVTRLSINLGFDASLYTLFGPSFAVTSDGRTIVATAEDREGVRRLYVRSLDRLDATMLPGTEGAVDPFLSPDNRWIGFFVGGTLRKIALTGGAAVDVADIELGRGGWWGDDGTIYFTPQAAPGGQVMRVASSGGAVTPVGAMLRGHATQRWPQLLPGGKALIYTGHTTVDEFEDASLVVHPLPDGPPRELLKGGYHWRYVPSGHIVYLHAGTLLAVPFDIDRLEVTGTAVPVVEDVLASPVSAGAQIAVSHSGTLAYARGEHDSLGSKIFWVDTAGKISPLREAADRWQGMAMSPDGTKIALDAPLGPVASEIWVYDIARDTQARLTINNVHDYSPVWTPDGARIVFASAKDGAPNLFWQAADGSTQVERLLQSPNVQIPGGWDPEGRRLLFSQGITTFDLYVMTLPEKTVAPFVVSPANEVHGAISPDGRWAAYASDESGMYEVYVRPFPSGNGRWLVSRAGGAWPVWSQKSGDLYYGTAGGQLMAVSYTAAGASFSTGTPRPLPVRFSVRGTGYGFALHPDGRRFATEPPQAHQSTATRNEVVLVFGFGHDLKARAH